MVFRKTNFFYLSPVAVVFVFIFSLAHAQVINITVSDTPTSSPQITIADQIKTGTQLLKSSSPLLYETTKRNLKGDLARKQIALAILNTKTGEIFEKRVWVKESDIKNSSKTGGVVSLTPDITGETLNIEIQWWNSFNSFFTVSNRPEMVVIADKYLMLSQSLFNLPERSKGQYTNIVYSPYSDAIHLSEITDAGKVYLAETIKKAFNELESARVLSHFSGSLITSDISEDFIKNIILVEHIDPAGFQVAGDGGLALTERVLAIIGANQEMAYRYTGSYAGASGLAQFISSTYKTVVREYPEAKLIKDYRLGMADHVNAIKAMVLFFDGRKREINRKIVRRDIVNSFGITDEMLAAAYNGGPARVSQSVNKYGSAWLSGQLALSRNKRIFKQETIDYIKKFDSVKNLNLFANISVD